MERCLITRMADRLLFHDQDTLNIILQDEKKFLLLKYNFQTGFLYHCTSLVNKVREEVLSSVSAPVVIHYTGPGNRGELSYPLVIEIITCIIALYRCEKPSL